ncbi:hypothetical protein OC846_004160 [Tilletia horrida]|uniref:Uncharacterized protein n=1 Tax=Tilletia horrida TaxID=155126 RepID=A0AAN6JT54_9BASI|nr:hypothetical protein OC845_004354 [Tilletia horrida]KAK0549264.1 hypothetical protein OC846_004160 [Tilletia horrida]KAK0566606.1 hypothetical protein OC861_003129 [Tilletia horrida]
MSAQRTVSIPIIKITPPSEPHRISPRVPPQLLGRTRLYVPLRTEEIGWEPSGLFWAGRYSYPEVGIYGGEDNRQIGSYRGGPDGYRFEKLWDEDQQEAHLTKQQRMRHFAEPSPQSAAAADAACNSSEDAQDQSGSSLGGGAASNKAKLVAPQAYGDIDMSDASDIELDGSDSDVSSLYSDQSGFNHRRHSNSSESTILTDYSEPMSPTSSDDAGEEDKLRISSGSFSSTSLASDLQKISLGQRAALSALQNPKGSRSSRFAKAPVPSLAMPRPRSSKLALLTRSTATSRGGSTGDKGRASSSGYRSDLPPPGLSELDCDDWLETASGWEYERRCEAQAAAQEQPGFIAF